MSLILDLVYIYIAVYSLFFLFLAIRNFRDRKFRIDKMFGQNQAASKNLCLIIYSHNNEKNLKNIIKLLKHQDYPVEKFSTYVILDNCSDNSERVFEADDFVNVCAIKEQGTIGKDQAISILLEKLAGLKSINAYVFLDAERYIDKDFLSSINSALTNSPVISGATVLMGENLNLRQKIKTAFHKYYTKFILKSRTLAGCGMTLDSDIFVISRELMEKIGCVDFQNINAELKYSLLLSKIGFKCQFNPNIKTYINVDDFSLRIPSFRTRLNLFKNCLPQTFSTNFAFFEHTWSLITPNVLLVILLYFFLLNCSCEGYFDIDFSIVVLSFAALILGFSLSLITSKLKSKEIGFLFLYPIYSFGHILKRLPICRAIRKKFTGKDDEENSVEKLIVDVIVADTDGTKNIMCKLALISENGLAKVKFLFKSKTFTTKSHLRMVDAISELIKKLSEYGFTLKVCQCCANFTPNIDGSTNMVKGFCCNQFVMNGKMPTLLWNSCDQFKLTQVKGTIDEIFQ